MHNHTNFDRAVTLTRAVDAALMGDDTSDQKGVFDAIYATLETMEAHEAGEHEQLDEEDEYELMPAGVDVTAGLLPYIDEMEAEFSPFSPSVGTFEGTDALAELVGAYKTVIQRAPVAERVHVPFKGMQKTIGEAFTPCGAD